MPGQQRVLDTLPEHEPDHEPSERHRLRVEGLVRQPLDLTGADLEGLPQATLTEDFRCEEGWTVPEQRWSGVSVGELLAVAGIDEGGTYVEFAAADFRWTLPLEEARHAIVAAALNGSVLSHIHGGPSRLIVPGGACFSSIKWLDRIVVRDTPGANTAEEIARARLTARDR